MYPSIIRFLLYISLVLIVGCSSNSIPETTSTPAGTSESVRSYGGERALSGPWAVNTGIEMLRRKVLEG